MKWTLKKLAKEIEKRRREMGIPTRPVYEEIVEAFADLIYEENPGGWVGNYGQEMPVLNLLWFLGEKRAKYSKAKDGRNRLCRNVGTKPAHLPKEIVRINRKKK